MSFAALIRAAEEWRLSVKEALTHCENSFRKAGLLEKEQEYLDAHKKQTDGQCSDVDSVESIVSQSDDSCT